MLIVYSSIETTFIKTTMVIRPQVGKMCDISFTNYSIINMCSIFQISHNTCTSNINYTSKHNKAYIILDM